MASIEKIRNFKLFDLVVELQPEYEKLPNHVVPLRPNKMVTPIVSDKFCTESALDFPVILNAEGVPWADANLYMLGKFKEIYADKPATFQNIATDLTQFLRWLENSKVDYLCFSGAKFKSPLYRYERFLRDYIHSRKLASSTAVRKMNAVIQFYRWLQIQGKAPTGLWKEFKRSVSYTGDVGRRSSRQIITTDLTSNLRRAKQVDRLDGHINDGGSLRPLQRTELQAVRHALTVIGNTEMALAFDFAVLTGARLGSALTLQLHNFDTPLSQFDHIPKIRIGGSSSVNNKFDKEMVLLVPPGLYQRVQTYLKSERYLRRQKLSLNQLGSDSTSKYVFLTKYGTPYYHSNNDENLAKFPSTKTGNAVTQFITGTLKRKLREAGHSFPFKFHDLRATFGINLLEYEVRSHELLNWNSSTSPDYLYLLNYIRERMGHSSLKTTEGYLTYNTNKVLLANIQSGFEDFMFEMDTEVLRGH